MLAPPLVFPAITTELMVIIGEEPINILRSECGWLLDLPGQAAPKRHPHLILCMPDVDDEVEMRIVQTHVNVQIFGALSPILRGPFKKEGQRISSRCPSSPRSMELR